MPKCDAFSTTKAPNAACVTKCIAKTKALFGLTKCTNKGRIWVDEQYYQN